MSQRRILFFVFWRQSLSLPTFHLSVLSNPFPPHHHHLSQNQTKPLKSLSTVTHLLIGERFMHVMHLQRLEGNNSRIPLLYVISF